MRHARLLLLGVTVVVGLLTLDLYAARLTLFIDGDSRTPYDASRGKVGRAEWTAAEAEACLAAATAELERGTISRMEIGRPGPGGPNVSDVDWIVLLEGATAEALAGAAGRLGAGATGPGLFRLEHALRA